MAENKTIAKTPKLDRKKKVRWTKDDTELSALALPTTVWYFLFCYLPMFGIILAFKDYKIVDASKNFIWNLLHSEWVGLKNFQYFLSLKEFPMYVRNTIGYNVIFIVLDIVLPVGLAMMISNIYSKRASKTYQTMMFLPHFMSWVVVSYFVYAFLADQGLLNTLLGKLGKDPVRWYSTEKYWYFIIVFMHIWKGLGYSMVVYLASITGIDSSLYEAAVLDGASKGQQARYITLPSLMPIIIMMFILSVGRIFSSDFGLFYQVSRGGNKMISAAVTTFDVQIYKMVSTSSRLGQNAAASMFQSVIGCILILTANAIVRKVDRKSALI